MKAILPCGLGLYLFLACLVAPSRVLAGGVVGDGTPASCTEAALEAALTGGGTVTFNCGVVPVSVNLTHLLLGILKNTTLDGGGRITLSGAGLDLSPHVHLTLANLTISGVVAGTALYNPSGRVSVTNVTFSNIGGTAIGNGGTLTVTDSTFSNTGHGIDNSGKLAVTRSTFASMQIGIFNDGGRVSVSDSSFTNANYAGAGGGIFNNEGTLAVSGSTFADNSATAGGAGIYNRLGKATITNSTFTNNSADFSTGGAIYNAGKLTVTGSTFDSNHGGDASAGAIYNGGPLILVNSTFFNNTAGAAAGAAIFNGDKLTATNCTFANNGGGADGATLFLSDGKLMLKNTIVASAATNTNCAGPGAMIDKGYNLDSGSSCGFGSRGSISAIDPGLDPAGLADNGGPTQTVAVQGGSPAVNAGNLRTCSSAPVKRIDQRGFPRPGTDSSSCTIGAYEFNSPAQLARRR